LGVPGKIQVTVRLKIDHVTIAGSNLSEMEQSFARVGLATQYGGIHSNGITHMALLGLEDGSYLELISTVRPGEISPLWNDAISLNGGPCAWAVAVDDMAGEVRRVTALGIPIQGPSSYHRRRPDGVLVEWDLAFPGDHGPGAVLPFFIQDRTPRELRVGPPASVSSPEKKGQVSPGRLTGVALVILGVKSINGASSLFQRLYGWRAPHLEEDPVLGASIAFFDGTPVALAAPLRGDSWLSSRLARLGELPCAFLMGTGSLEDVSRRFPLGETTIWLGRKTAWLDRDALHGIRLGVMESQAPRG